MKRTIKVATLSVAWLALMALPLMAATNVLVLPAAVGTGEGGNQQRHPWGRNSATHQQIFAATEVASAPVDITQLRYRLNGGVTNSTSYTFTSFVVELSTSPRTVDNLLSTFASNRGTDVTQVFNGSLTVAGDGLGATPNAFTHTITFTTPFRYDPAAGDLLVEMRHPNRTGAQPLLDTHRVTNDGTSQAFTQASAGGAETSTTAASVNTEGFVVEFTTVEFTTVACPSDTTIECAGATTDLTYDIVVTDSGGRTVRIEVDEDGGGVDQTQDITPASATATATQSFTSSFSFTAPGPTTQTVDVTATPLDGGGNPVTADAVTCSFDVTVQDTTPPVITCPGLQTAECTSAAGAVVTYPDPTVTDTCDPAPTFTCVPASGSTFAIGTTTVTCTGTDATGNSSTCTFDVLVQDTTDPVVTCNGDIVIECSNQTGVETVDYTLFGGVAAGGTATDTCDPAPVVVATPPNNSPFTFTAPGPSITTVNVTATDNAGNAADCSFTVTIQDTTPPTMTCPADIAGVECTSSAGAVVTYTDPVATDICDAAPTVTCSPPSGSTFPLGTTTVTCIATDASGNTFTCTFNVTVVDTTPPVLTVPANITAECTSPAGAPVAYSVTATDVCDPAPVVTCTPLSGSIFPIGTTTVTCTATDASGNTSVASTFTVTVQDTTPPVITCPPAATLECTITGGGAILPGTFAATATDQCDPAPVITYAPTGPGGTFTIAASPTVVTATATDSAGNSSTCTFTVTVVDTTPPPTPACGGTVTLECTGTTTAAAYPPLPPVVDICSGVVPVVCIPPVGAPLPLGLTTVTCTATDTAGNASSCSFDINVVDTTAPVITCPANITQECTAVGGNTVTFVTTATDVCDPAPTIVCTPPSGSVFDVGVTTVTCTATDSSNNTSTCTFTVTITDTTPPVPTCPANQTLECTGPGGAIASYTGTAVDTCDANPTISFAPPSGSQLAVGTTTVTMTATDSSGNSATCTFTVLVQDTTPPTITCPADVTAECTGPGGATVVYTAPVATDICDPNPTVVCTPASGTNFAIGTTLVTCTATDAAGLTSTCTFNVIVQDTTPPVITCPGTTTVECTSAAGALVSYTTTATDVCDPAPTIVCTPASGSTFAIGTTTVTCTATDTAGNVSTCTFDVVVEDTTPPVITCPANITQECTTAGGEVINFVTTATDICDPAPTIVCTPPSGSTFIGGVTTVTCTATDTAGNSATCTFTVTITDTTPPVPTCPANQTLECTGPGGAIASYTGTAVDTCDPNPTISFSPPSGSQLAVGTTTVTMTATDSAGNSATCTFTVLVQDTTPPTITCPADVTAECTGPGGATVVYTAPVATDICDPNPTVVCTPASGTNFAIGTTLVTCTATDAAGLTSTCTFNVIVQDTTPPVITCPGTITQECTGPAGDVVTFTTTATDVCDPAPTIVCVPASGSTFAIGTTTVTCTATDTAGNVSTCTFDVVIQDTTPPVITCPGATAPVECTSPAGAVVAYGAIPATDTCDPAPTVVCVPASGSTFPIGTTTVTCTATDAAGNSASCTFDVTVQDTTPPVPTCPANQTLECTGPGGAIASYTGTATDICDPAPVITFVPPSGSQLAVGTTTVTMTATDSAGNAATCTFTVLVQDTTPPTITCPADVTAECTGPGGATVVYTAPVATDICDPNPTVTCVPASGTNFAIGTTLVTCTATDAAGLTSTCTFNVIVQDTTPPVITCPGTITQECTGPAGDVVTFTTTATDVCDPAPTIVCVPASGSTFAIGTTTVTCTATDTAGNASTCTFDVVIQDTTPPTITCPANPAPVECTSSAGAVVTYAAPTVTDVCDPAPTVTCVPASGSTFALGVTTVTCTATDAAGNVSTCTFDVTVQDTTPPVPTCPANLTLECTGPGGAIGSYTGTATDVCDPAPTVSFAPPSGTQFAIGTTTVTMTATDNAGNAATCTFTVTVQDTTPPTITCPGNITFECDGTNAVSYTTPVATDICDPNPTVTCTPASGSVFPLGLTTVTCTATDAAGLTATCTFTINVVDTTPPVMACPGTITIECTGPGATTPGVYTPPTATDLCDPAPTVTCTPAPGTGLPLGTNVVTCTATDASGNVTTCTFDIVIVDTTPPTITCPAPQTAECTSAAGAVVAYPAPTTTDICDPAPTVVCTPPSGSTFAIGVTTVTCTSTDSSGNAATCTFDVTVVDTTPPVPTCPANITAECTGPGGAVVTYSGTATDVCDPNPTISFAPPSGTQFAVGTTTVTMTATDTAGNSATCTFTVTVQDTTPPTITCPGDVTVECTSPAGDVVTFTPPVATDICDPNPTVTCVPASGTTFAIGTTLVTCTATDAAGLTATCTFNVIVQDTTPPVVTCPGTVTLECTGPGTATLAAYTPPTATDTCDPAPTVTCVPAPGTPLALGTTTVTCTATDASGNSSTCQFDIDVVDTTPPTITCPTGLTPVECTGPTGAAVTYPAPTVTDICDTAPVVVCTPPSGSTLAVGTHTVTCTATDSSGNAATCTFTVSVVDTTPPSITCPADIAGVECTSSAGAQVNYTTPIATDICDPSPTVVCTPASGATFPLGTTVVTCTATDAAGLTATCTFNVTVVDTTPPVPSCPADLTIECTGPGATTVASYTGSATDTCDPSPTVSFAPASGSTFGLGTTVVTMTATDNAGNAATCTFNVIVVDTTPPAMTCPGTITAECAGPTGTPVTYTTPVATDICDPAPTVTCTPVSGFAFPLGTTTVTCTATDSSGNTTTCQFDVVIQDTTPPTITCPADVTGQECTSAAGAVVSYAAPTVTDICDPAPTVTCTPASGSTFPIGTTFVTCTATDASGNSATCTFTVEVVDTTPPTITCPANIGPTECTSAGGALISYATPTATDICDPAPTVVCDPASGTVFPLGLTTVTCTATDSAGNAATCTFTVNVVDTTPPVLSCQDPVTAECNPPAPGGLTTVTFAPSVTDICDPTPTVVCTPPSGSGFPLGQTTVTCTATDVSGNSSTCTFTVSVIDTTPPVITCAANQTLECTVSGGGAFLPGGFVGATATDTCDPAPVITYTRDLTGQFPFTAPGPTTTTVVATATDASGNEATCSFDVIVQDTTAPVIVCPVNIVLECTIAGGGANLPVTHRATATDTCDPAPVITYSPDVTLPFPFTAPGPTTTTVTATATDASNNVSTCTFDVTVQDTTPPTVSVSVGRSLIWHPSAGLFDVRATWSATDVCDTDPATTLTVWSDETESTGFSPDATYTAPVGTTPAILRCRAERDATGNGRVYVVRVESTDASNNVGRACTTVVVPLTPTVANVNSVNGQASTAQTACANNGTPGTGFNILINNQAVGDTN